MFSYYGCKTKIVNYYPKPIFDTIIEPFAGSARYSLEYFDKNVILIESDPRVFGVLKYLQQASIGDILSLPNIESGESLKNEKFAYLSKEEDDLIGYQLRRGSARPNNTRGTRCSWETDKIKIADNLYKIRHWDIRLGNSLEIMPKNNKSTYFIDPPYSVQSHKYTHWKVDYKKLKGIIDSLDTQVIVCGNSDDKWLDFQPLVKMRGTNKDHVECVYLKNC